MSNSLKVHTRCHSGSGSTGFLNDAPRVGLTPGDPVLRCNHYQSITVQLHAYRGLRALQEARLQVYREEQKKSYEQVLDDWRPVMELCKNQRLYI